LPARPTPLEGTVDSVLSATIQLAPEVEGELAGATVVWLGDLNGDGLADAAVGLPAARNGAGRVVIVNGRPGGWPVPPAMLSLTDAESSLVASQTSSFGQYLAPAGDVNGDGLADLLIGDPTNGLVYVVFGQTGPLGKDWDVAQLKEPTQSSRGVVFTTNTGGDGVGAFMAAAGDVNKDGIEDIVVYYVGIGMSVDVISQGQVQPLAQALDVGFPSRVAVIRFASGPQIVLGDNTGGVLSLGLDGQPRWNATVGSEEMRGMDDALIGGQPNVAIATHDGSIGVYDAQGNAIWTHSQEQLRRMRAFDLNGDGIVDGADLGLLLAGWGTADADLNGDGSVDLTDLVVVGINFGKTSPQPWSGASGQ